MSSKISLLVIFLLTITKVESTGTKSAMELLFEQQAENPTESQRATYTGKKGLMTHDQKVAFKTMITEKNEDFEDYAIESDFYHEKILNEELYNDFSFSLRKDNVHQCIISFFIKQGEDFGSDPETDESIEKCIQDINKRIGEASKPKLELNINLDHLKLRI